MSSGNTELSVAIYCLCAKDPMAFTSLAIHISKNKIFLINDHNHSTVLTTSSCSPLLKLTPVIILTPTVIHSVTSLHISCPVSYHYTAFTLYLFISPTCLTFLHQLFYAFACVVSPVTSALVKILSFKA